MIELVLFGLLASIITLFFINHSFFNGKLLKKDTGYFMDFIKYGIIILVLIITVKYVFYN